MDCIRTDNTKGVIAPLSSVSTQAWTYTIRGVHVSSLGAIVNIAASKPGGKSHQASLCCMLLENKTGGNMAQGMGCMESLLAGFTSGTLSWKLLGSWELSTSWIHSSRSTGSHMKSVTQSSRLRVPRTDTTSSTQLNVNLLPC